MNESGNGQDPTPIGEILPHVVGAPEDVERKEAVAARDVDHEIEGYEGEVQNLVEEVELHPDNPELEAALQAAKMQHLGAVADRIDQGK